MFHEQDGLLLRRMSLPRYGRGRVEPSAGLLGSVPVDTAFQVSLVLGCLSELL